LDEIFKITGSRKSRTIIASKGVKNIENDDFINTVWMEYPGVLLAVPGYYHRNNNYNRSYRARK